MRGTLYRSQADAFRTVWKTVGSIGADRKGSGAVSVAMLARFLPRWGCLSCLMSHRAGCAGGIPRLLPGLGGQHLEGGSKQCHAFGCLRADEGCFERQEETNGYLMFMGVGMGFPRRSRNGKYSRRLMGVE
jgi:hypothetical protein